MQDATIYTIAEKAGCSASTVSRVINNYPYVKKATRAKVLSLLQEYNYVPNETARSLVNRSTRMIGILISDIRTTHHTNGVYYIQKEFGKNGYTCLIYNTGLDPDEQVKFLQILGQRKVEGVIMMGSIYQNEAVRNALPMYLPGVPTIMCYGYIDCPDCYGIISDEIEGICRCVKLLHDKKRKNPVCFYNFDTPSTQLKLSGYRKGMNLYYPGTPELVVNTNGNTEIHDIVCNTINENPDIDSIIFVEDYMSLIGLQALSEMKKKVPEDIAVISVNNSSFAEIAIPKLTSLDIMIYDISLTAVRNMISLLKGEHINKKMVICSEIFERESC